MPHLALISVFCPDRTGLVAAITGNLFDLGADLGDTTFAVLGTGAEFTAVCEVPDTASFEEVESSLAGLEELAQAKIGVTPFTLDAGHGAGGTITHRITVLGGDQPGLIARLCEVFGDFKANIVRLSAERMQDGNYAIRLSVAIPEDAAPACLATVANTAEGLQLDCKVESS
ncbi:MAG: ACT domain-containing protein [Rhodospirillales bacterium]|nr:ACT domain-containing protein [Rhodospirillales bacterium]